MQIIDEKYQNQIDYLKQKNKQCLNIESPSNESHTEYLKPNGTIIISLVRQVNNIQETDVCLGTSTMIGFITASSCCDADEMFLYNFDSGTNISVEENSIWTEKSVCFINSTKSFNFKINEANINENHCSIMAYNSEIATFDELQLNLDVNECTKDSCIMIYDKKLLENRLILNGTAIVCDQSTLVGLIIKRKQ